jgi:hypothetical protein
MRTVYVNPATRAIADLVRPGELTPGWTITRINVPKKHRGKGEGRSLLRRICTDADVEGVTLYLEVLPSGGLDFNELTAWYGRYGFKTVLSGYMRRLPKVRALQGLMNEAHAMNQVCPNHTCQAPVGMPCKSRSNHVRTTPHVSRYVQD